MDHKEIFEELRNRQSVPEIRNQMEDPGEFSKFIQEINNRGYKILTNLPNKIIVSLHH